MWFKIVLTNLKEKYMKNQFSRTESILGKEALYKLNNSHVAVFGLGGVGGYVVEALVRSGIGAIDIIDNDKVDITNLNRQIIATASTIGKPKTDVMEQRILEINPEVKVKKHSLFFNKDTAENFDFSKYDYIIDAIDTVTSKIELIMLATSLNIPIISSMGTGNKLNPTELEVTDIYKTSVCPLARVMRYELKKRGIKKLKVVYSKEEPIKPQVSEESKGRHIPASAPFVPACAGLIIASEVVKDIIN